MGVQAKFQIDGLQDIVRNLQQLDRVVRDRIVTEGLNQCAELLVPAIQAKVPPSPPNDPHPGLLRNSIVKGPMTLTPTGGNIIVGTIDPPYKGDVYYASMVEYGHGIGKRQSRGKELLSNEAFMASGRRVGGRMVYTSYKRTSPIGRRKKVKAYPYMRPAMDENKENCLRIFRDKTAAIFAGTGGV